MSEKCTIFGSIVGMVHTPCVLQNQRQVVHMTSPTSVYWGSVHTHGTVCVILTMETNYIAQYRFTHEQYRTQTTLSHEQSHVQTSLSREHSLMPRPHSHVNTVSCPDPTLTLTVSCPDPTLT